MPPAVITRPGPSEYAPFFATYIDHCPPGDVLATLAGQIDETCALLGDLSDDAARYRYAPDKWSIKEVIGHVTDTERIMVYRAVCFARGETGMLPGFDENAYVANANFDARSLADLLAELRTVRAATLAFFSSLNEAELERRGRANQRDYSVRVFPFVVAGHERHHVKILRERYLPNAHAG
jgi:uncharacterized damage-inducible protein DinB